MTRELGCTAYSIKANTRCLCANLGVATRQEAVLRARELGLLEA